MLDRSGRARKEDKVLAAERRLRVLERAAADQAVEVSGLARDFQVSEITIRRDLLRLERDGFVRRTYGGATTRVVRTGSVLEVSQGAKTLHHAPEKHQIALRANELTAGARVIYVGVGSTIEQFARVVTARDDLMVVTSSMVVASLLATRRIRVISAGGLVRPDELSCVGASAVDGVRRYNTDVAVIGAGGISARWGLTDLDDPESEVTRAALERTRRVMVLADGSKFGDVALITVAPIERVSVIVTDPSADPAEVARIEHEGVEVIVTTPSSPLKRARDGSGTGDGAGNGAEHRATPAAAR
jgi:DeoR/GlpR family transcriptional regulator of sugar metabolism